MGGNQLYTGDAFTVPPGLVQLQVFQNTTPNRVYRLAGTSLTFGLTRRLDVRAANSHLWSDISPNATLGPNLGIKWRFIGNGKTTPSMAVSALYSTSTISGGRGSESDYGALIIGSYPVKYATFLGNAGRVWVGTQQSDLYYLSFALVRNTSKHALTALEYSAIRTVDRDAVRGNETQYAAGLVYAPNKQWSYSFQVGYLPNNPQIHIRTTLGLSVYF